jgi:hypothetical protein
MQGCESLNRPSLLPHRSKLLNASASMRKVIVSDIIKERDVVKSRI